MSGGVDSSVAAALLVEQGHEVVGAYMKNWINEERITGHCPWEQDIEDASAVADQLGVPFRVVNLMKEYRERVVRYLLDGYEGGITPNPDVMCNREMKFGVLLDYALEHGFEGVATGHYARARRNADGSTDILRGTDPNKDQSYFLAMLDQRRARRAWFPIGELLKPEVRDAARRFGLKTANKKDSQGICFIGEVRMKDFLAAFVDDRPGDIVTVEGGKVGRHRGLHLHTLGQRRGLGVASSVYRRAYVVVGKRPECNQLVVGFDDPETPGLYADVCAIGELSQVNEALWSTGGDDAAAGVRRVLAQARYRTRAEPAFLRILGGNRCRLEFDTPQRALTPGQICAFYDGAVLLGGGVFETVGGNE